MGQPDTWYSRRQPQTSYSTVTFASLITAAHFATSPGSMADISAGVFSATGRPWRARFARTDSFASAAATALYNRSITAAGVFAGANNAVQASASTPGTP